jgi:CRISPR/Cas system-associated protein Cas7 (RAMP superfamily)
MTDNMIIKALECCVNVHDDCENCPVNDFCEDHSYEMIEATFNLIKRQKAEIERLEAMIDAAEEHFAPLPFKNKFDEYIEKSKAEAIKEFAKRLNKEAEKVCIDREGDFVEADGEIYDTVADWCKKTSDNLLEEMVGDSK